MAILKCKMCGGELEIGDSATIATCEYCGTKQTLPKATDSATQNLFNRANDLRIKCEFDRAEQTYEKILELDNSDAEAHWGLLLCRYGIEYVDDPGTGKKIPTCHRASFDPILTDSDYLAAVEMSDGEQKALYIQEAKQISEIQKGILQIAQNEAPFDVFLCYKETGEDGKRTVDSVIANDIYYQLTQEGYKVFYAPITLEDKLGSAYEPHIFAALNSAKVMLVIGTKPAHFDAVWVKNEWSRFLALTKKDRTKLLIPCYKDMDPYDLPDRFAHLQAQDMGKIGFINDVVRGIKKVISTEPVPQAASIPAAPAPKAAPSTAFDPEALLKRAALFLADQNWTDANAYCEKVLDAVPECAQAYLYKLMAELHIGKPEQLSQYTGMLAVNKNYNKIMVFADPELKAQVSQYEKICRYNSAIHLMNTKSYTKAKDIFTGLDGFRDSEKKVQECLDFLAQQEMERQQKAEQARLEQEQARLKQEIANKKKALSHYTVSAILLYVALFLLYLPFLMTDLHIENEEGLPVFIGAIVLLLPVGVLYFIFAIKSIIDKKHVNYIAGVHRKHVKVQEIILLLFTAANFAVRLLDHERWLAFSFEMHAFYFLIAGALVLMNLILLDFKSLWSHKSLLISLALLLCYLVTIEHSELEAITIAAVSVSVLLVILFIIKKVWNQRISYSFNLIPFICSLLLSLAVLVSCISLNNSVEAKQEALKKNLAGKVFSTDAEVGNFYTFTYIFDHDGTCTELYRWHDYDTETDVIETRHSDYISIYISYFGSDIQVEYHDVLFNDNGEIVAFGSYNWTDSIPSDDALADYVATLIAQYQAEIPTE